MAAERKLKIVVGVKNQTRQPLNAIKDQLRATMEKVSAIVKKGVAAAGAAVKATFAAAAGGILLFAREVKRQFAEIDKLAKDALRFGIAVSKMRGLQLAAKLSGNEISTLLTLMRDLGRRTSEAAQGTGESADALRELGLDARELNALPVNRQLDVVLKALRKVENHNDRIRLAYDTMGRSGTQALTLLRTNLVQTDLEAERLFGTLTQDAARGIEEANDQATKLRASFSGVAQAVAIQLGGPSGVLNQLTDGIVFVRRIVEEQGKLASLSIQSFFHEVFAGIADSMAGISAGIGDMIGQLTPGPGANVLGGVADFMREFADQSRADMADITDRLNRMVNEAGRTRIPPFVVPGVDGDEDGGGGRGRRGRRRGNLLPQPQGGRLVTGAALAGGDSLRAEMSRRNAEAKRQASEARDQRRKTNELLGELLRQERGFTLPAANIR